MEKSVGYEEFKLAEGALAKDKVSLPGRRFPLRYLQVWLGKCLPPAGTAKRYPMPWL